MIFLRTADISNPTVDGPVRALSMALKDAGMQAREVEYINAHATSTPAGDASEARAIHHVFGGADPYVSSTKSMTGHECWMAGASEIVYSMLMMENGLSPQYQFRNPDETHPTQYRYKNPLKDLTFFLSNSLVWWNNHH